MELLIDADMLCYLSDDEEEPATYVLHSVKLMIADMMEKTKAKSYRVLLSSPTNFRYDVASDYKANRKDKPKPYHFLTIKNYLKKYFNAEVSPDGLEADDYIAQLQTKDTCIASLDKDFLTVIGKRYKWRHHNAGNVFEVTEDDAEAFLCYQLLIGDKADNIISPLKKYKANGELGKVGFGHVAARDFLLQLDYKEMRVAVFNEYKEQGNELMFDKNYKLLAIGRVDIGNL